MTKIEKSSSGYLVILLVQSTPVEYKMYMGLALEVSNRTAKELILFPDGVTLKWCAKYYIQHDIFNLAF